MGSCQVAILQACQEKEWENVKVPSGRMDNCFQLPEGQLIEYHCHFYLSTAGGFFTAV